VELRDHVIEDSIGARVRYEMAFCELRFGHCHNKLSPLKALNSAPAGATMELAGPLVGDFMEYAPKMRDFLRAVP
jgi:hypothetical protein